jgi:inorganic phosphate transporter, PiT family
MDLSTLVFIVALALVFDYINGFHDAANAIATLVATRVLPPRQAVIYGAVLNFVGAFIEIKVATTIGKGIISPNLVTPETLIFALLGAIIWNLATWLLSLPTSSSHALIGALCGAAFATNSHGHILNGVHAIQWQGILQKVILPMFSSPVLGFLVAYSLMTLVIWGIYKFTLPRINKWSARFQLLSSGFMALNHGSNDAQKSMGIIALAVSLYTGQALHVHTWIIALCALAMGLGTLSGGWKIIRTLGTKMVKLQPIHGSIAELTAGSVIMAASHLGLPLSTTQVITTSIMGVGATRRLSALKFGVVANIVWAWVLTLPLTFLMTAALYWIYHRIF